MSQYNPRIYNYSNLTKEDQNTVDTMSWAVDSLENLEDDYRILNCSSTIRRIFYETALEVLDEAEEQLKADMIGFIVSCIDSYDYEVKEIDTTDFFFGMEGHCNNDQV